MYNTQNQVAVLTINNNASALHSGEFLYPARTCNDAFNR